MHGKARLMYELLCCMFTCSSFLVNIVSKKEVWFTLAKRVTTNRFLIKNEIKKVSYKKVA